MRERATIVDHHSGRHPVLGIGDRDARSKRQRTMRGCIAAGVEDLTARGSAASAIEGGYDMLTGTTSAWPRMGEEPGEAPAMGRYSRSDDTRNSQTKQTKTRTHFEHPKMPPRDSFLGCEDDLIVAMVGLLRSGHPRTCAIAWPRTIVTSAVGLRAVLPEASAVSVFAVTAATPP